MPINIDGLSITFHMDPKELELFTDVNIAKINEEIAIKAKNFWMTLAGQNLFRTREFYIESIAMEPVGPSAWRVHLGEFGKRPNFASILELGSSAYDLKPGFLKNAKVDQHGARYRIIPINGESGNPDFRIVRPGDDGWEHPGFPGWKFQDLVVEEALEVMVAEVVDDWFSGRL